jgi:hypothetical protein
VEIKGLAIAMIASIANSVDFFCTTLANSGDGNLL